MGLQVSHNMDTEMQKKKAVWRDSKRFRRDIPRVGATARVQNSGRARVPGAYPHADRNTAEVCRIRSGRVYQREECDSDSPNVSRETAKFQRTKLLGAWVLRVNRRTG